MEKVNFKVKRKHIPWKSVMDDLGDLNVSQDYFRLKTKNPKMSENRCAFYALKMHYSTTAITYYRIFGEWNFAL